jgi:integrase
MTKLSSISSDSAAKKICHEGKDRDYSIGDGLYLRVRKSSKTWLFQTKQNGKRIIKTLGHFPDMDIKSAKKKALELKTEVSILSKSTKLSSLLAQYYERSIIGHENKKNQPHKRPAMTKYYLDILDRTYGHMNIDNITADHIETLIRDYRSGIRANGRGDGTRAANQLHNVIKTFFKSPAINRRITGKNPVESVSPYIAKYSTRGRERVLTDNEIKMIFESDHPNSKTLRFILLTGVRISETRHGKRNGEVWEIGKEFTKNGQPHWCYLPPLAMKQLPLPKMTDTNLQAWLRRWLENLGYAQEERFTPHDLRRTFATRLHDYKRNTDEADSTGMIPPYIIEKCLNHSLEGVLAVYNRAEYKQQRIEAAKTMEKIVKKILES